MKFIKLVIFVSFFAILVDQPIRTAEILPYIQIKILTYMKLIHSYCVLTRLIPVVVSNSVAPKVYFN